MELKKLYWERFCRNQEIRLRIWKVLCKYFFQQFIEYDDVVLDLGAGYCEFINNINCREKHAVDFNENVAGYALPNVKIVIRDATDLSIFPSEYFNKVFMSNFLEHLSSKDDLIKVVSEVFRILKKGGEILILSPDILYVKEHYWDFLDHYIPLTHNAIKETLLLSNFRIKVLIPKFLPYSTLSRFPKNYLLVKMYLKLPPLWFIFGKQMFIVAEK